MKLFEERNYYVMRSNFLLSLFLTFILAACGSSPHDDTTKDPFDDAIIASKDSTKKYEYYFLFGEVHDRAIIYVNGDEVFEASTNQVDRSIEFGLDDFLTSGKNKVKVELYNDQTVMGKDTSWEIYYELFNRSEPIDFVHEETKTGNLGLVFETVHEIEF